jgi:hypothetical protein
MNPFNDVDKTTLDQMSQAIVEGTREILDTEKSPYNEGFSITGANIEVGNFEVHPLRQVVFNETHESLVVERGERYENGIPQLIIRTDEDGFSINPQDLHSFIKSLVLVAGYGKSTDARIDALLRQANEEGEGTLAVTSGDRAIAKLAQEAIGDAQFAEDAFVRAARKAVNDQFGNLKNALKETYGVSPDFIAENSEMTVNDMYVAVAFGNTDDFKAIRQTLNENSSQDDIRRAYADTPAAQVFDIIWSNTGCLYGFDNLPKFVVVED